MKLLMSKCAKPRLDHLHFGNVHFLKKLEKSLLNNYLTDSIEVNSQHILVFLTSLGDHLAFFGLVV